MVGDCGQMLKTTRTTSTLQHCCRAGQPCQVHNTELRNVLFRSDLKTMLADMMVQAREAETGPAGLQYEVKSQNEGARGSPNKSVQVTGDRVQANGRR